MDYDIKTQPVPLKKGSVVILPILESETLLPDVAALDADTDKALSKLIKDEHFKGRTGELLYLPHLPGHPGTRILLVGFGTKEKLTAAKFLSSLQPLCEKLRSTQCKQALISFRDLPVQGLTPDALIKAFILSLESAFYTFDQLKSEKSQQDTPLSRLDFHVSATDQKAAKAAIPVASAIAQGMQLCKDLGNLPANLCTPTYLADQAEKLAETPSVRVTVYDEQQIQSLGMHTFLSVAKGSQQPPKLIELHYQGAEKSAPPYVLVGKGITFDAGGISLKPAAGMDEMKYDMCGAASVMGTFKALSMLNLPINVIGLIPACENLPDGQANKPGDIITSLSGQTVEILNTDAEGRLILCDTLTYAEKFQPSAVIDIATLTGACIVALGNHAHGLLGNSETLIHSLLSAGVAAQDRAWELPLWEEYQDALKSNFADMANVGGKEAGTITAACFLSRFTQTYPWAHLDIAGTAWKSGKAKGATGRPVPLLVHYLVGLTHLSS